MLDHYYAVIMAGGGGTRLWPLSRKKRPKQMISLFDDRTLFQTSVQRLYGAFPPECILVVTVQEQAQELQSQTPEIPEDNFLIEPAARGTASVIGLAAVVLQARDPQAIMAVVTSDQYMGKEELFRALLRSAHDFAAEGYLVTLGIEPTFAATGFGYIQRGAKAGTYRGLDAYHVLRFKEKPDEQQARALLASGDHSWNSGMFVWRVEKILDEISRQMPALATALQSIQCDWGTSDQQSTLERIWPGLKSETIDYGVMEGAAQVVVIPAAGLEWSDVGSWDSLFEVVKGDDHGNIIMGGTHVGLETKQTLIYVEQEHRLIVTIGVEDLVLVDTGDVLLVCRKDQAQKVRQVVDHLKLKGQDYL